MDVSSTIVLSPSRYDRSPESVLRAVRSYIATRPAASTWWKRRRRVDTTILTEMQREARVRPLRSIPGHRLCRVSGSDGRDECAILSRRSKWVVDRVWVERLSDIGLPTRNGQHVWALCVERHLRWHPKKKHVVEIAVHFPAHHDIPLQRAAWVESTTNAGNLARRLIKAGYHVRMSADVNKNWRSAEVREVLNARLNPMTCNWAGRMPEGGTHGDNVIDHMWSDMECEDSWLMRDDGSSDHRPSKARHSIP